MEGLLQALLVQRICYNFGYQVGLGTCYSASVLCVFSALCVRAGRNGENTCSVLCESLLTYSLAGIVSLILRRVPLPTRRSVRGDLTLCVLLTDASIWRFRSVSLGCYLILRRCAVFSFLSTLVLVCVEVDVYKSDGFVFSEDFYLLLLVWG